MRANKKGLSNIVATVLIILLAIAAVVIVWSFVSTTLRNTASEVDLSNTCFNTEVKPVSCTSPPGGTPTVNVQFVRGNPSTVSEIIAVLVHQDGTTDVVRSPQVPGLLGSARLDFTSVIGAVGDRAQATAVVYDPANPTRKRTCDLSLDVIQCT